MKAAASILVRATAALIAGLFVFGLLSPRPYPHHTLWRTHLENRVQDWLGAHGHHVGIDMTDPDRMMLPVEIVNMALAIPPILVTLCVYVLLSRWLSIRVAPRCRRCARVLRELEEPVCPYCGERI